MPLVNFDSDGATDAVMAAPGSRLLLDINWEIVERDRMRGLLATLRQWPEVASISVIPRHEP